MNTNSPLVPQGTTPQRGKSSLYFKILMILMVHVVLIGGMLLQGCKDTAKDTSKESSSPNSPEYAAATNVPQETMPPVNINTISNNQVAATQPATQSLPPQPAPPIQPPATLTAAATSATPMTSSAEYVVATGDTFAAIAKKQHVSLKVLMEANPGVDAKKLRVGQKVQIPAGGTTVAAASSPSSPEAASGDGSVYVVKTGDTLGKIARLHGTSFKKLMALNDLKTTSIHVGQKLKMPSPKPLGVDVMSVSGATALSQTSASAAPATTAGGPASATTGASN
jgi:LysM repeat protein